MGEGAIERRSNIFLERIESHMLLAPKSPLEKWDNGYQFSQRIVMVLIESISHTSGAAPEGDPSLVSTAVSAIIGSVDPTLAKMPDFSSANNQSSMLS